MLPTVFNKENLQWSQSTLEWKPRRPNVDKNNSIILICLILLMLIGHKFRSSLILSTLSSKNTFYYILCRIAEACLMSINF